jgi:hypothetical protein
VIDESRDDLFRASSAYAAFSRAYTSIEAPVPFHPGAKQYLDKVRPIGSVTPERPRKIKGSGGR